MTKFYKTLHKESGLIRAADMNGILQSTQQLFDGYYLVSFMRLNPQSDIKEYRACYFAKIDAIASEAGETRYDMHELVKDEIITDMQNLNPELFTDDGVEVSTRYLTPEGWIALLDRLDLWAFVNYNTILQ